MPAEQRADDTSTCVAVIGMACRFAQIATPGELWTALTDRRDLMRRFPPTREQPDRVPAFGVLEGVNDFDAGFFDLTDREARILDPQHRVFLECVWETLEDAGHDAVRFPGHIGVYAGAEETGHYARLQAHPWVRANGFTYDDMRFASEMSSLPSRVAYTIGTTGPAFAVQGGCPTSLLAVHLAVQALIAGECDLALAGAANIFDPPPTDADGPAGVISPDGFTRMFDVAADGVVMSNGVGVVALRRLDDALEQGDPIRAVIRGSAAHHDGARGAGFPGVSVDGMADAIRSALWAADVDPSDVDYIQTARCESEAGLTLEIEALRAVFPPRPPGHPRCVLGGIKANLGHSGATAGIAGLIATVLAMEHQLIPGTPQLRRLHPKMQEVSSTFTASAEDLPWPRSDRRVRRAGITGTAHGGLHLHMILEEPPSVGQRPPSPPARHLLPVSARSAAALDQACARLSASVHDGPIADIAWTLQTGRREFAHRAFAIVDERRELTFARKAAAGDESGDRGDRGEDGADELARVGSAWLHGEPIDWAAMHSGAQRRMPLPTYPFQRRRVGLDDDAGPRWLLTRRQDPDAALRLYCFPHSGGSANEYTAWADHLAGVELWGVQLPGRGSRFGERHMSSVDELVSSIISEVSFDPPYALFGHSFGALLAFEVARELLRQRRTGPCHVFVSACAAPTAPPFPESPLHLLDDEPFVDELERLYGPLPADVHRSPELKRIVVQALRADMTAAERYVYRPGPPLLCPLTVTGARSDHDDAPRLMPWAYETTSAFELTMFEGDHFYFRQSPQAWFTFLRQALAAVHR